MIQKHLGGLVLMALAVLPLSDVLADGLRCGERLVEQGMIKSDVEQLCGEPDAVEENGAAWIYDRGVNQFLKVIKFADDVVQFIDERQKQ